MDCAYALALSGKWVNAMSDFPEVEQAIKQASASLVEVYLPDGADRPAEKMIKSFSEPIYYLKAVYFAQQGMIPGRLSRNPLQARRELELHAQIKDRLMRDVMQLRIQWATFLGAICGGAHHTCVSEGAR